MSAIVIPFYFQPSIHFYLMDQDVAMAIAIATIIIGTTIVVAVYRFFTTRVYRQSSLISDESEL